MKKRMVTIGLCALALFVAAGGFTFAGQKGSQHYKAKCTSASCHCSEFWSEIGTSKCYYCGHYDYMHKRR